MPAWPLGVPSLDRPACRSCGRCGWRRLAGHSTDPDQAVAEAIRKRREPLAGPQGPARAVAARSLDQTGPPARSRRLKLAAGAPPGWYNPNKRRPPCPANTTDRAVSVITTLNTILELELAGVVRYVHYSLMVFGRTRTPIVSGCATRRPRAWTTRRWLGSMSHRWAAIRRSRSASSSKPTARHQPDPAGGARARARDAARLLHPARSGARQERVARGVCARADPARGAAHRRGRENDAQAGRAHAGWLISMDTGDPPRATDRRPAP